MWHVPSEDSSLETALEGIPTLQRTPSLRVSSDRSDGSIPDEDDYSYVVVMERGESSLFDVCARQRVAGYDIGVVRNVVKCVAELLIDLHEHQICHGDLYS